MSTIGNVTVVSSRIGNLSTTAAPGANAPRAANEAAKEFRTEDRPPAQADLTAAQVGSGLPQIASGKLQLDIDRTTGQVVGRIVDKETGATIKQIPSDEALRLMASNERILGALLDKLL
jgi:uncharacterized FlaG/YvyC family protein